jgi:ribonucleoside-diphosphate reductase alpha chain
MTSSVELVLVTQEIGQKQNLHGIWNKMKDLYKELSNTRKELQAKGLVPEWYTTAGYQMFVDKYEYDTETSVKGQFERLAKTAAKHLIKISPTFAKEAEAKFFDLFWKGWLSPATPVLANMGTDRGMPVSCSGGFIDDSIDGFYTSYREVALLTKEGFGTSSYLGYIRPRGSKISKGGKSSGVVPVFKHFVQDMRDVTQGTARRGAWAGYLEITHGDFDELCDHVMAEPDDANVGWIITDAFIKGLKSGNKDYLRRYQKAMKLKMVLGKGYFFFVDKVNRSRPKMYQDLGLTVKASNLCSEITLFADIDHTYTCVLSSMNVAKYDEWKDTDAVYWATIFLDCVAEEFIQKAKNISGLEQAVRFTEKGRALGLGQCGFHTYLQDNMIAFESLDAMWKNAEIAKRIDDESLRASKWMAETLGEPEWCRGYGVRNTHRIAIAPTKSTAALMGGVSEGINPDPAMVYTQMTSAGEVERVNPKLLGIMKERKVFNKKTVTELKAKMGSVQHVEWLSAEEKLVFKTAFEIDQVAIIRLASQRKKFIDQWQSLNLFFSAEESEAVISRVHQIAFEDENILALYYIYSSAGVQASNGECLACQ